MIDGGLWGKKFHGIVKCISRQISHYVKSRSYAAAVDGIDDCRKKSYYAENGCELHINQVNNTKSVKQPGSIYPQDRFS